MENGKWESASVTALCHLPFTIYHPRRGLQLVPLSLLLSPGGAAALLRGAPAPSASVADDRQLRVLRVGEPAVRHPALHLDAGRLHRGIGDCRRTREDAPRANRTRRL